MPARQMLVELAQLLPKGLAVYVVFDSWYASKRLIKFCRRQNWQVICAIKSNRRIDKSTCRSTQPDAQAPALSARDAGGCG